MEHQPFKAYKQQTGTFGFFVDDACKKFYSPFNSEEEAQEKADWFKDSLQKPQRFTDAWKRAINWLADRSIYSAETLLGGNFDIENASKYQELPLNYQAFEELMGEGRGVRAFALQMYSFYNSGAAVEIAVDQLELLTPWAVGSLIDEEGREIIIDLMKNYSGW